MYELALDKHYNNNLFLYLVWAIVNVFVEGLDPHPIFGYACVTHWFARKKFISNSFTHLNVALEAQQKA